MRTIVKGKNAEIPDRVREYAERKLKRIERLLDDRTDATVEVFVGGLSRKRGPQPIGPIRYDVTCFRDTLTLTNTTITASYRRQ